MHVTSNLIVMASKITHWCDFIARNTTATKCQQLLIALGLTSYPYQEDGKVRSWDGARTKLISTGVGSN